MKKKSNWKEKHLEFITAIRYARGVQHAEKYGTTPPPVPPPMKNPGYIRVAIIGKMRPVDFKLTIAEFNFLI